MQTLLVYLAQTLTASAPLCLAALGGVISERSGVATISLEAYLLGGAFAAAAVALATASLPLALLGAVALGAALAGVFAWSTISLRANAIVAGVAVNLLAAAGTRVALKVLYDSAANSPALPIGRASTASIGAAALSEVASANASLAGIEVRLARQNTQRIRSPRNGTVLRLVGGQGGEMVKPGDPLLVLVPDTDARAAELWVDGNDAPLLAEGRRVRLQFEGWPAVQFTGWPSVAVGTFGGRVALIDSTDNGQGKFRVLVVPDGEQPWPSGRYLRQGVRANGWVLLNQVRLGYELWRLFNGFPPTVAPAEPRSGGSYGSSSGGSYGGSS